MTLINSLQKGTTRTENGMVANTSTANVCLDLFGSIGAMRGWSDEDILRVFSKAMATDPATTIRILFWVRDVRGGQGERRIFRLCFDYLNQHYREFVDNNLEAVPFYGRWDDLFHLNNRMVLLTVAKALDNKDGLCAKWLPRKGMFAELVRKSLRLSPKEYRKKIVALSKTVEQQMCSHDWDGIKYEHVPSQAMHKYNSAFYRHDEDRFKAYIDSVLKGNTKINASTMYPYQLYEAIRNECGLFGGNLQSKVKQDTIAAQWNALPNYLEGVEERVLPVCDVSGSMNGQPFGSITPMSVSVSLGLYISERNIGPFKDAFITFSMNPQLQILKGDLFQRCKQLLKAQWDMNTDLGAVFNMLLGVAKRDNLPESEMPTKLLIISDMQFDACTEGASHSAMSMIDAKYAAAGYKRPGIVFWNVRAVPNNYPVFKDSINTSLVSGCSPSILTSVLTGKFLDPVQVMMDTVYAERYDKVWDGRDLKR